MFWIAHFLLVIRKPCENSNTNFLNDCLVTSKVAHTSSDVIDFFENVCNASGFAQLKEREGNRQNSGEKE